MSGELRSAEHHKAENAQTYEHGLLASLVGVKYLNLYSKSL